MTDKSARFWLHAYAGRENGLMVVGDRPSIRALGEQLVAASDAADSSPSDQVWPVEISKPEVAGPYVDVPGFVLSFHLEGAAPAREVLPLCRRHRRAPLRLAVAGCAVIGSITILRWVVACLH